MNKKMIFFDIDGTLLNENKEILVSTRNALKTLKENGHELAIATGRNLFLAQKVIDELEFNNYIVCNGAVGYYHHEQVFENSLDPLEYQKLLQVADENEHQIVYQSADFLRSRDRISKAPIEEAMNSIDFGVPEYDREFYQTTTLCQSLIFYSELEKHHYENDQFPKFRFVRWHDVGVDILPYDGSKANTALKIAEMKGFSIEDTIAFGDGLNDLELLTMVGTGVAMGNAVEQVKSKATYVTDHCNEDGIAKALAKLKLI